MKNYKEIVFNSLQIGHENAITRAELVQKTGLSDRMVRDIIAELRREHCICNNQDRRGYYIPKCVEEAEIFLKQEEARAKSIFYALKVARDYVREHKAV